MSVHPCTCPYTYSCTWPYTCPHTCLYTCLCKCACTCPHAWRFGLPSESKFSSSVVVSVITSLRSEEWTVLGGGLGSVVIVQCVISSVSSSSSSTLPGGAGFGFGGGRSPKKKNGFIPFFPTSSSLSHLGQTPFFRWGASALRGSRQECDEFRGPVV